MERGEVYYLRYDNSVGHEIAVGRPVLIISTQKEVDKRYVVTVAYLTTKYSNITEAVGVKVKTPRNWSWVLCNQLQTVDKERLTDQMCKLTTREMEEVDDKLAYMLGLQLENTAPIEVVEGPLPTVVNEELLRLQVELNLYKKLYADLTAQIVDARFERQVVVAPEAEIPFVPKEEKVIAVEAPKVVEELNIEDLAKKMSTPNIELDDKVAPKKKKGRPIISGKYCRPTTDDLVEYKKPGKVNINTDDWKTIAATTGMSVQTAQAIVAYRNKHGAFIDLTDLLFVPRFGSGSMNKYGQMLET